MAAATMNPKRDRTDVRESLLSSSLKSWPLRLKNKSSQIAEEVQNNTATKDGADPNSEDHLALWMKRLGLLFPGNASLKEETLQQSPLEPMSHPTRRLPSEDVLRNVTSVATATTVGASSNAPPSILKSDRVHSSATDTNLNLNERSSQDTVYMLRLLMMSDFFSGYDRVNLGLPATERHHNSLAFKPDSSNAAAVNTANVNLEESKEEEDGGGKGGDNEHLGAPEAKNEGQPPQSQASLTTLLATYKPRRNSLTSTSSESHSNPAKALRTLQALVSASKHTATIHSTGDSESQPSCTTEEELSRLEAELLAQSNEELGVGAIKTNAETPPQMTSDPTMLLKYKPRRKISPQSSEKTLLCEPISRQAVFDSFMTMNSTPSTGTFRDTKKRSVPTVAKSQGIKTRTDSWGLNLKGKPCSNDNTSSSLNVDSMLNKQNDLFPSTGTFRDSAKRHVRTKSESNQDWDIKPRNVGTATTLSRSSMPSSEKAAAPPVPSGDSVRNFLRDNIFPSTGTFRDTNKRHLIRHVTEPSQNQEWELKGQNDRYAPISNSGPSIGFMSTGSMRYANHRHIGTRHCQQELEEKPSNSNQEWGELAPPFSPNTPDAEVQVKGSEPKKLTDFFLLYMENKAKLTRELQPQQQKQPSVQRKAAELHEPASKGGLLVDWGDQGTDSEDESYQEVNNGTITFVKNGSSRRISDITTADFDDETGKTLGRTDSNSKLDISVEMGKGLIRNMSALTLLEISDEELDKW